tara:strand:+ start:126 stop:275 length:150 start_codon:yes stop_codon:yes gene_type:complete
MLTNFQGASIDERFVDEGQLNIKNVFKWFLQGERAILLILYAEKGEQLA